jgi:hypothetical protein
MIKVLMRVAVCFQDGILSPMSLSRGMLCLHMAEGGNAEEMNSLHQALIRA